MKLPSAGGHLALGLAALVGQAQSFPTAENLAKLAQADTRTPEQLHEELSLLKERGLLSDSLKTPIQGELTLSCDKRSNILF